MPTLRRAAQADMTGWQPAPMKAQELVPHPPTPATSMRNPNMLASMPAQASTADVFQRQFYGGTNIPSYRILPGGSGDTL